MFLQRICERLGSLNDEMSNYVYHSFCNTFQRVDVFYGKTEKKWPSQLPHQLKISQCFSNGKKSELAEPPLYYHVLKSDDNYIHLTDPIHEIVFEQQVRQTFITYRNSILNSIPLALRHALFTECVSLTKPALLAAAGISALAAFDSAELALRVAATAACLGTGLISLRVRAREKGFMSTSLHHILDHERRAGSRDEAFLNADGSIRR